MNDYQQEAYEDFRSYAARMTKSMLKARLGLDRTVRGHTHYNKARLVTLFAEMFMDKLERDEK